MTQSTPQNLQRSQQQQQPQMNRSISQSPPDSGRIRCVCQYDEDDGFTIQCEQCLVWQHAKCVGIGKNSVPEQYFCDECNPGWHENLHNLALKAINHLDVINNTTQTTSQNNTGTSNNVSNVNIIIEEPVGGTAYASASGSTSSSAVKAGFKRKISVPVGAPALNEIGENIVANEAQPVIEAFLKGLNIPRLRRQQQAQDANLVNFEFQATVVMESAEQLALLQKNLEVREIRNRGYQKKGSSTKYGLFSGEACDPGHFVCEYIGHVQLKNLLTVKGAKELPVSVTQSYVLYPFASLDLAVDARKFGSGVRYARRSCRPNVQIKPILVEAPGKDFYTLSWGLFARNVIRPAAEILLPLDYQCGNGLFRYECACNSPDFCLGPLDNFSNTFPGTANVNVTSTSSSTITAAAAAAGSNSPKSSGQLSESLVQSAELEALGIRRSSSAVLQDAQSAPTTNTRPILDTRKLSREERKLQKYIEYFEKMDNADAAKKSSHPGASSSSLLGSSSRKNSSSAAGSPNSTSRLSSPEKPAGAGLKKAWKQLFSGSAGSDITDSIVLEPMAKTKPSTTGAKRGRKPGSAKKVSSAGETDTIPSDLGADSKDFERDGDYKNDEDKTGLTSSPPKIKTSPKRVKRVSDIAIIDEEEEEIVNVDDAEDSGIGSSSSKTESKNKSKKTEKSKTPIKKPKLENKTAAPVKKSNVSENEPVEEGVALIDIERSSSVINGDTSISMNNNAASTGITATATTGNSSVAAPDTPSKKKLSLSDYLKKKKASPIELAPLNFDEEEGEIRAGEGKNLSAPSDEAVDYKFLASAVLSNHQPTDSIAVEEVNDSSRPEITTFTSMREILRQSIGSTTTSAPPANHDEPPQMMRSREYDPRDRERRDREREREREREKFEYEKDYREKDFRDRVGEVPTREVHRVDSFRSDPFKSDQFRNEQFRGDSVARNDSIPPLYRDREASTSSSSYNASRFRDDREKEFDRLQREREFERRERERERERELRREQPRERERDHRDHRDRERFVSTTGDSNNYQQQQQQQQQPNYHHHQRPPYHRPYRPHNYNNNNNNPNNQHNHAHYYNGNNPQLSSSITDPHLQNQNQNHHHYNRNFRPPFRPTNGNNNNNNNSYNYNNNRNQKY